MPNVGDMASITLLVSPFDDTTEAVVVVTKPDGDEEHPVATTGDGGNTWQAPVEYSLSGSWVFKWTVTGTGSKTEYANAGVAPGPLYEYPGRVYADTTDLANWLGAAPPDNATRLLARASSVIDDALLTAVYATGADGMPTDSAVIAALRNATCAVVEWWESTGDELGSTVDWQSASAGDVSISRNSNSGSTQVRADSLPPRALGELIRAGLLPGTVYQL